MKKVASSSYAASALLVAMVLFLVTNMHVTEAQTCSPVALSPCLPAIQDPSQTPTTSCCNNLRDQKPCLCGYLRNPFLRGYVNSPGSRRVASVCNVPTPRC